MTITPPQPKISIRRLSKSYGPFVALRATDLEIYDGEFLTLLGPSGSGKTTLLSMIAGLVMPDAGEIWIDGRDVSQAPPEKRDVGMVFQNYALFPHMTVAENIAFPLRMRKREPADIARQVSQVLDAVRLPQVADRYPHQLSGGQQQRIALARCMVYQPSVVLMDEPLGALDKKLREQMQLEIKRLHSELATTVLYVTHDQEEALVLSDRICLMNNASIEQLGSPQDLYFRPASVFAADFLGDSNLLDVTVRDTQGAYCEVTGNLGAGLRCSRGGHLPDRGDAAKLMVRPENVELLANDASADNEVRATISGVTLFGEVTRYYGTLADGTPMTASTLTRPGLIAPATGAEVRFGWSKEAAVLVPTATKEA